MSYYCFVPVWELPFRRKHVYSLSRFPFYQSLHRCCLHASGLHPLICNVWQATKNNSKTKINNKKLSKNQTRTFICPLPSAATCINTLTSATNESLRLKRLLLKALIAPWTISRHNEVILHLWDRLKPNIREMTTLMDLSRQQPEFHSCLARNFFFLLLFYIAAKGYCRQYRLLGVIRPSEIESEILCDLLITESRTKACTEKMSIKADALRAVHSSDLQ